MYVLLWKCPTTLKNRNLEWSVTDKFTFAACCRFCYFQHNLWNKLALNNRFSNVYFSSVLPGMSLAWSPDKRLSVSSGSSVVCMLGFLHPATSLARSLLWAIPAQHVRPVSCRIACLTSAAIIDPNFSLSWQPQEHGLVIWKNNSVYGKCFNTSTWFE